jgi:RimJ/RimL family protein N-acetyltransferase
VGYHIVPPEQGRGYATEAARASVAWVFANTPFDVVCSIVAPENAPSRAVASNVHTAMRTFTWAQLDKEMCLYWTERPAQSHSQSYRSVRPAGGWRRRVLARAAPRA